MVSAKDIIIQPIKAADANAFIKRWHYSGKVVQNSQLHLGVFLDNQLHGVMQFGPSLDKRKLQGLVEGTQWHEFIELNRLAFDNVLPRNSESRALAVAMRLLRKHAPQLKWVISFADATQCGDGTIYRASGFVLTGIKENTQNYLLPFSENLNAFPLKNAGLTDDDVLILKSWLDEITPHKMSLEGAPHAHKMSLEGGCRPSQLLSEVKKIMRIVTNGKTSADTLFSLMGGIPDNGFQLRYIYFIDRSYRSRLTVPEIPFSEIEARGAAMYKGEKITRGRGEIDSAAETTPQTGGASPTRPL